MTTNVVDTSALIGRVINDKYRLVDKVAEGGMAVVYKAEHIHLGDIYAIKIIKQSLSSQDEMLKRFKREFRLTQAVQRSPYIIRIYDFGMEKGVGFFYAMELLHGKLLTSIFNPFVQPPPAERTARLICQACEGLGVVHEENVVHRDIKPDNIFLHQPEGGGAEMIKLLDFGIARKTTFKATMLTNYGRVIGTPEYMSPEQCKGPTQEQYESGVSHLDGRSDVYSLGILLYEGLTGQVPFPMEGDNPSLAIPMVMKGHVKKPPLPPSKLRPDLQITEQLEKVVLKALQKKPEERFQTMYEFRDAIIACYPSLAAEMGVALPTPAASTPEVNQQYIEDNLESTNEVPQPDFAQNSGTAPQDFAEEEKDILMQTALDVELPNELQEQIAAMTAGRQETPPNSGVAAPLSRELVSKLKDASQDSLQQPPSNQPPDKTQSEPFRFEKPSSGPSSDGDFDNSATLLDSQLHADDIQRMIRESKEKSNNAPVVDGFLQEDVDFSDPPNKNKTIVLGVVVVLCALLLGFFIWKSLG